MVAKMKKRDEALNELEKLSFRMTNLVGTPLSLIFHSFFFFGIFGLLFAGLNLDQILLILTTAVSLEAIYLAIFIQMTVNRNTKALEEVEEDIEEIQEDVEGLEGEVEEISDDIEGIQAEDVKDDMQDAKAQVSLQNIEDDLEKLQNDIAALKSATLTQSTKKYLNG